MYSGPSELEKIAFVYGDVCVRKRKLRRKRQKLLVNEMFYDYAQNSTLHGLRYIVERGLNIIEKLFWLFTVAISIALCSILIYNVYMKWITSPVIVTVNGRLSSVGTVPFPSVTICPQYKVKPTVYNFTKAKNKLYDWLYKHAENPNNTMNKFFSKEELVKFYHINSMCDFHGRAIPKVILNNLTYDSSYIHDITEVALTEEDIFIDCRWYDQDCYEMFSRVYTETGVCYTVNSLAAEDIFENSIQSDFKYLDSNNTQDGWSIEKGYNSSVKRPYPRRGHFLASSADMSLILIHDPADQDKSCNGLYSGYNIYLNHPADFPQSSQYYYSAVSNQVTSLAISFHLFNTDPSLSSYPPETRQCYFQNDRKLRYFKIYTTKNCQAECLSNYTYERCGCVGFYMPHYNNSEICPSSKFDCMDYAKDYMSEMELEYELTLKNNGCLCLAECNTIEYDAEVLKTEYTMQDKLKHSPFYNSNFSFSEINLYFKKPQFVTMQRREMFGITDLLANIGGLLGLFLGFSFISLIEVFYFFTLRVGFTLKRDLDEERAKKEANSKVK